MIKVEFSRTAKVPFAKRYDNYIGGAQLTSAAVYGIVVADFVKAAKTPAGK